VKKLPLSTAPSTTDLKQANHKKTISEPTEQYANVSALSPSANYGNLSDVKKEELVNQYETISLDSHKNL